MGNKENKMFCFQCQETAGCSGCTVSGVCGKKPDVAAMQDLLVYVTKGLSAVTTELRFDGKEIEAYVNEMIIVNLFTTITNANFDKDSIIERIENTLATKEELIRKVVWVLLRMFVLSEKSVIILKQSKKRRKGIKFISKKMRRLTEVIGKPVKNLGWKRATIKR